MYLGNYLFTYLPITEVPRLLGQIGPKENPPNPNYNNQLPTISSS